MDERIEEQNIQGLKLNNSSIDILNKSKIKTIGQLCQKTKKDLRDIGIISNQINEIEVKLELVGLNLKNIR